ncbi:response regulator, partial [Acinetobacter baumannii]|nr:response regulator [Acinetobacter baumannii]
GELLCVSEVGKGSVFSFSLPLVVCQDAPPVHPASASRAHAGRTDAPDPGLDGTPHVLLVEDNPVNAMIAEAELRTMGVQVTVIDNGRDAVDWLARQRADLVLMDCEMPVMDGFEATR